MTEILADMWKRPLTVEPNNFVFKSLSNWSCNVAVGCSHACRFCYVPEVSTNRMKSQLEPYGVTDPDADWGKYLLLRTWDERAFWASVQRADRVLVENLKPDGNRAVMLCTTTDPYQVIYHPDAHRRKELTDHLSDLVRSALQTIRDRSTLNVRILTRSPLAMLDFDIMQSLGKRCLFGMSLPTLSNRLAEIYEPHAPSPSVRLKCLQAAKRAGLNVFVAMAPTYPECDAEDILATLRAIKDLDPVTVFHEPINIRADNVQRIQTHAWCIGQDVKTEVFATPAAWATYAMRQLCLVEMTADHVGLGERLHLWPDKGLGNRVPPVQLAWLKSKWERISEWPK